MAGLRAGVMEFREYVKQLGSEEAACNWVVKDYNEKFGHPVFGFGVMPENQQYVNELNEEPSK